jgi:hypothetical protein
MPGRLHVTLRARTFHFVWGGDETDYVCGRCMSVSVDGQTCQHCEREQEKKRESLRRFLEQKAREKVSS